MKKIITFLLAIVLLLSSVSINVFATEDTSIKRVVSIVYDDSGSMDKNDNWAYASYSLQNLLALLSNNDEVNVVRMSNPNENYILSLATDADRIKSIKQVEGWRAISDWTPFAAVDTATKWLKDKNTQYQNNDLVEYWLIVLTDGEFHNENSNIPAYLSKLKDDMLGSKIETIFLGISNSLGSNTFDKWSANSENFAMPAGDKDGIVDSMAKVAALVTGRGDGLDSGIVPEADSTGTIITADSELPLRKIVIFEQNQNVDIETITSNGKIISSVNSFETKNPGSNNINGKIIHCNQNDDVIPAGKIKITFKAPVDVTKNNFKLFFDAAVEIKLIPVNNKGVELSEDELANLVAGQTIEYEARAFSSLDDKEIDLSNWTNAISGTLMTNSNSSTMTYDKTNNCFKGSMKLEEGSNNVYAIVKLDNYFRVKSNLLTLYPRGVIKNAKGDLSKADIIVPYCYTDDYEIVDQFVYQILGGEYKGTSTLQFINIPKGLTIEANGKRVDSNGKVTIKMEDDEPALINVLRNKDFTEKEECKIDIESDLKEYDIEWADNSITEFNIIPKERKITFKSKRLLDKELVNKIKGKKLYEIEAYGDNKLLSLGDLQNSKINVRYKNEKFKTTIKQDKGKCYIEVKDNHFVSTFIKTGKIQPEIELTTMYGETGKDKLEPITIIDSFMKFIDLLLWLLLLVFLIGYLPIFKKRFNRKARFDIEEGRESYDNNKITIIFSTIILPFVNEKGRVMNLYLEAGENKKVIVPSISQGEFSNVKLNGDIVDGDAVLRPEDELTFDYDGMKNKYIYTTNSNSNFDDDLYSDNFNYSSDDDLYD